MFYYILPVLRRKVNYEICVYTRIRFVSFLTIKFLLRERPFYYRLVKMKFSWYNACTIGPAQLKVIIGVNEAQYNSNITKQHIHTLNFNVSHKRSYILNCNPKGC